MEDERIERLESDMAMQERTIEELNEVIYTQQKQIDSMEIKIEALIGVVKDLKEAVGNGELPRDEPPPHYGR